MADGEMSERTELEDRLGKGTQIMERWPFVMN